MPENSMVILKSVLRKMIWSAFHRPFTEPINNGVASLEKIQLGGFPQWCLIRGSKPDLPILLFIHGGPGSCDMAIHRFYNTELENHFIVVYWDQRGGGKSFNGASKSKRPMVIDEFVNDAYELVLELRRRFNQNKIFILGHSWGSVVGLRLIHQHPEVVQAYIGMGQVVCLPSSERESFDYVLAQAAKVHNQKDVAKLKRIGPPIDAEYKNGLAGLGFQRKLLLKYGGSVFKERNYNFIIKSLFDATEYSFTDTINYLRGMSYSLKSSLWKEITSTVDFRKEIKEVKVPCYFFAGKHDYQTSFNIVESFVKTLRAPHKELVWFDKSGHMPCFEEPSRFNQVVVDKLVGKDVYQRNTRGI